MALMRNTPASRLVGEYRPPASRPAELAGPCMVERCTGQLEIRHERQYGKIYTVCPECERRVGLVSRLRAQLQALREEMTTLRAAVPKPAGVTKSLRVARNAEIARRYQAGESVASICTAYGLSRNGVYIVLRAANVVMRKEGRPRRAIGVAS